MTEQNIIFISHSHTDQPIAVLIEEQIRSVFGKQVTPFATSIPGTIKPGKRWLSEIEQNLDTAKALIVLITPVSINRPWIWFELGASWLRNIDQKVKIFPVYVPEIDVNDLPSPLNEIQATPLGKAEHVKLLFQELCNLFGCGNMTGFKASTLSKRLPSYPKLKVSQEDLLSGTIYTGHYEGYTDDELEEVLIDEYLHKQYSSYRGFANDHIFIDLEPNRPVVLPIDNIFRGQLIHYRLLDENLKLMPGTSKRLLKKAASKFGLVPISEKDFENSIRFSYHAKLDAFG